MTTEQTKQPESTTTATEATTVSDIPSTETSTGSKRAFDEMQERAGITIHDLEEKSEDEADGDYLDAVEEKADVVEEESEDEDEESETEPIAEADDDVTVEELAEIIKDAGISADELAAKILRGGKQIPAAADEMVAKAKQLLAEVAASKEDRL